jgi:hypothetical protein
MVNIRAPFGQLAVIMVVLGGFLSGALVRWSGIGATLSLDLDDDKTYGALMADDELTEGEWQGPTPDTDTLFSISSDDLFWMNLTQGPDNDKK